MKQNLINVVIILIITFIAIDMYNKDIFNSIINGRSSSICMNKTCEGLSFGFQDIKPGYISEEKLDTVEYRNLMDVIKTLYSSLLPKTSGLKLCNNDSGYLPNCNGNKVTVDVMTGIRNTKNHEDPNKTHDYKAIGVTLKIPSFIASEDESASYKWVKKGTTERNNNCHPDEVITGFKKINDNTAKIECSKIVLEHTDYGEILNLNKYYYYNIINGSEFKETNSFMYCPRRNQFMSGLQNWTMKESAGAFGGNNYQWRPTVECSSFGISGKAMDYYREADSGSKRCKPTADGLLPKKNCTDTPKKVAFLKEFCSDDPPKDVPSDVRDRIRKKLKYNDICEAVNRPTQCDKHDLDSSCSQTEIDELLVKCDTIGWDSTDGNCTKKGVDTNAKECDNINKLFDDTVKNYEGDINNTPLLATCTKEARGTLNNKITTIQNAKTTKAAQDAIIEARKTREELAADGKERAKKAAEDAEAARNLQRELAGKLLEDGSVTGGLSLSDSEANLNITMGIGAIIFLIIIGVILYMVFKKPQSQSPVIGRSSNPGG